MCAVSHRTLNWAGQLNPAWKSRRSQDSNGSAWNSYQMLARYKGRDPMPTVTRDDEPELPSAVLRTRPAESDSATKATERLQELLDTPASEMSSAGRQEVIDGANLMPFELARKVTEGRPMPVGKVIEHRVPHPKMSNLNVDDGTTSRRGFVATTRRDGEAMSIDMSAVMPPDEIVCSPKDLPNRHYKLSVSSGANITGTEILPFCQFKIAGNSEHPNTVEESWLGSVYSTIAKELPLRLKETAETAGFSSYEGATEYPTLGEFYKHKTRQAGELVTNVVKDLVRELETGEVIEMTSDVAVARQPVVLENMVSAILACVNFNNCGRHDVSYPLIA